MLRGGRRRATIGREELLADQSLGSGQPSRFVPAGVSIGERLEIPPGPGFDLARQALSAIESVHGDGELPRLAVRPGRGAREIGGYVYSAAGAARGLVVSRSSPHPGLTFIHEVGHFLDHQTLGNRGRFASEAGHLAEVMDAIARSDAIRVLRSLGGRRRVIIRGVRGRREVEAIKQPYVAYLLQPREAFARAYAQYIAVRSEDRLLLAELGRRQQHVLTSQVYHDQWMDDDFLPIAQALDQLLRRKGWVR